MPIVNLRNGQRSTKAAAERVKPLRRFGAEVENRSVERIVLEIFKEASVKVVSSPLGGEGYVTHLRELRTIVEGRYFEFRNSFSGGIGVRTRGAQKDIGG